MGMEVAMALLSAPVNQLADFQLEYDGLLLGPGTPYDLPPELNLLDLVSVQNQDTPRDAGQDGAFDGPDSAGVAVFEVGFELYAFSDGAFAAAVQALRMTMRIRDLPAPLWFKLPTLPVYGMGAKVNNRHIPVTNMWPRLTAGAVQFRVTKPQLQSVARSALLSPIGQTGGLRYPLYSTSNVNGAGKTLDYGTTGTAAYSARIDNAGNTPARPVVVVQGPNTAGFRLELDGHVVTSPLPLGATDTVTVDYATGQAYLSANGSNPVQRTGLLTTRDFSAVPANGSSTMIFVASGGSALVTSADIWRG